MQFNQITLRVQAPNNQILTQNLYYNHYDKNPKYLVIHGPLGEHVTGHVGLVDQAP